MAISQINTNSIASGAVSAGDLADGSVSSAKLASGAAASNLGNYVSTVNGSTGAVTVQAQLVSGTNIKTLNGSSVLGSGDLTISSVPASYSAVGSYIIAVTSAGNYNYGSTIAGSELRGIAMGWDDSNERLILQTQGTLGLSGTWRAEVYASKDAGNQRYAFGLWVRIS